MIIIGITGSIATGKSTIVHWLKELGMKVFDSDEAVHDLFAHNTKVINSIKGIWPECVQDNYVDRSCLRARVLADPTHIKTLEAITHPYVTEMCTAFIAQQRDKGEPAVFLDIPLLYEAKQGLPIDEVLVVYTSAANQSARALDRGMNPSLLDFLITQQMPMPEKKQRADYLLDNDGTLAETKEKLIQILHLIETKHHTKLL